MLSRSVDAHRLVTVTGMGGTGKTRLVAEVVARYDGSPPVAWVSLAPVATHDGVVAAIDAATPSRVAHGDDVLAMLSAKLRPLELVLVLDNCEHLVDEVARVASHVLSACPNVRIVCTGREPLHLAGEQVLALSSLPVEPCTLAQPSDAVQLFFERARALRPDVRLDEQQLADVVRICRAVDGIPLAVELAAAWVRSLSFREVAARLESDPDALVPPRSDAGAQRTLETTLDRSYQLLPEDEQVLFRRLSVFAAPSTEDAIAAVCAPDDSDPRDVLRLIGNLVEKSLVVAQHGPSATRYHLLETVRRYAGRQLERLDDPDVIRRRHAMWLTEPTEDGSKSRDDVDEVIAALSWALEEDADLAVEVAAATWKTWELRGRHGEGRRLLAEVLEVAPDVVSGPRTRVLTATASLALAAGDYEAAREAYEQAIIDLRDLDLPAELAGALNGLSVVAVFEGAIDVAQQLGQAALERFESLDPASSGVAFARSTLGMVAARTGRRVAAEEHFLAALQLFRSLGLKREAASVLNNLGNLAADAGQLRRAVRFYEGALQLQREVGDRRGVALSRNNLCLAAQQLGDLDHAWEHAEAARCEFQAIGDRLGVAATTNNLANLAAERGRPAEALEFYGAAARAFRETGEARRLATCLHNLAELAAAVEERQLAWDSLLDAVSLWNQLGQREDARDGARQLLRHAANWEVGVLDRLAVIADDGMEPTPDVDPAELSHALEAARWVPIPPAPPSMRRPAPLTPRESQVAGLVGRGLSNAEIATQLFISERTVESHVSNARMKLDIDSRTKLARWAIEQGLST